MEKLKLMILKDITESLLRRIEDYETNIDNKSTSKYEYNLNEELNCFVSVLGTEFQDIIDHQIK